MWFKSLKTYYIHDHWDFKNELLAFKYLEDEHDGLSLCNALMDVFEHFEIAPRILGIPADNASNNTIYYVRRDGKNISLKIP
jgi:hypothetical protein